MKFSATSLVCLLLTSCGDNPFNDSSPILDSDYSIVRIEMERCRHIKEQGSWIANLRISPISACYIHLKSRIKSSGHGNAKILEELDV